MRDCTEAVKQRAEAAKADAKEWRERFQRCGVERQELEAQLAHKDMLLDAYMATDKARVAELHATLAQVAAMREACISLNKDDALELAAVKHTATAAQHDARVKAEALREAADKLAYIQENEAVNGWNPDYAATLRDRAAEIEKGAGL
jgi:hypothetical protein